MDILAAIRTHRPTPRPSASEVVTGILVSKPDADHLSAVSVHGSEPIPGIPTAVGVYEGVTTVRVLLTDGRPVQVLGPFGAPDIEQAAQPAPPSTEGQTQTVTRTITPTATATYRVPRSAWGRWGDAADVYQGATSESGQLWGLACYGQQVTAAGFASITSGRVTLAQATHTGLSGAWAATVRGSAAGSIPAGAPTYVGDSITISMPGRSVPGTRDGALTAGMLEGLRTGAIRSLGLVGTPYGVTFGLGRHGAAWALTLTGEVPL